MINWLIGPSGGGKSYEAVRYQIIPALEKGRHVITNLPLNIEQFEQINPEWGKLLHLRKTAQPIRGVFHIVNETPEFDFFADESIVEPPRGTRVFSGVWDFYFDDSYKTEKGQGPLFVVDECHFSFPYKATDRQVEDWFSVHRHYVCDVLLVTQSYGKVSQAIRDNTQMVYRCRKNIAFGSKSTYTRKVQDGFRGDVVNTAIRSYDPKYFPLYRSHTQGESVEEFGADDIVPLWRRWPFIGVGICAVLLLIIFMVWEPKNPMNVQNYKKVAPHPKHNNPPPGSFVPVSVKGSGGGAPLAGGTSAPIEPIPPHPQVQDDLLAGRGLHILLHIRAASGREVWKFGISQNGQGTVMIDLKDLQQAGYRWEPFGECLGYLHGNGTKRALACDAPTAEATVGGVQREQSPPPKTMLLPLQGT